MQNDPDAFTCAIGDGANDINMIQSAHIGVGIEGNEGNQAAYYADYAIPEFQALRRLMLWHGRSFGLRAFSVFLPQIIFNGHSFMSVILYSNFVNGFSGYNIFVAFYYGLYSIVSTNFVPCFHLTFDNDVKQVP